MSKATPPQVAAQIRAALRTSFPDAKFSVTCTRGTGYGWISCTWTDGPTEAAVSQVTDAFADQMWFGCKVNRTRRYSDTAKHWVLEELATNSRLLRAVADETIPSVEHRHYLAAQKALARTDLSAIGG